MNAPCEIRSARSDHDSPVTSWLCDDPTFFRLLARGGHRTRAVRGLFDSRKVDNNVARATAARFFDKSWSRQIYVEAAGGGGGLPTHAGGAYSNSLNTTVDFNRPTATSEQMALSNTGSQPADITFR